MLGVLRTVYPRHVAPDPRRRNRVAEHAQLGIQAQSYLFVVALSRLLQSMGHSASSPTRSAWMCMVLLAGLHRYTGPHRWLPHHRHGDREGVVLARPIIPAGEDGPGSPTAATLLRTTEVTMAKL